MKRRRKRVRVSPLSVFWLFLLLALRTEGIPALLCAVALHEGGHLLVARMRGIPIDGLTLGLGGAQIRVPGTLSYRDEFFLAAGGPLAGLLAFAFLFPWAYGRTSPFFARFLLPLSSFSLVLSLLNLLPIRDLDGGRMLRSVCASLFGDAAAEGVLRVCSLTLVLLLWLFSSYLLLRDRSGLSIFLFSCLLFTRFFVGDPA